jgi:hypothetical protein
MPCGAGPPGGVASLGGPGPAGPGRRLKERVRPGSSRGLRSRPSPPGSVGATAPPAATHRPSRGRALDARHGGHVTRRPGTRWARPGTFFKTAAGSRGNVQRAQPGPFGQGGGAQTRRPRAGGTPTAERRGDGPDRVGHVVQVWGGGGQCREPNGWGRGVSQACG